MDDWRWQLRNAIRDRAGLERLITLTDDERHAIEALAGRFRMGITPYYASLMTDAVDDPIRRQVVPTSAELDLHPGEVTDPLAEEVHQVVPGLTVRHRDRALLYVAHTCAVYCRHCTRRRKVGDASTAVPSRQIQQAVDWLAEHPEVWDIVLSGGDPLSLSTPQLDALLSRLRALPHPVNIRIGTRHPVALPMRFDEALLDVLQRHGPLFVMTHFNHPQECTPAAAKALRGLRRAGCTVLNQAVLLAGVNDDEDTLLALHRWLVLHGVKPYRLFHCDNVEGTSRFKVPFRRGLELEAALRQHSGLLVPEYVVDLPRGGGKVRVCDGKRHPQGWVFEGANGEVLLDEVGFPDDGTHDTVAG